MAGLLIFADICTPPARLRKPLSKDGFSTLENRPKPLAGHLYGLAKIVTGGRNPKSKPSLPHARTALSRQKATRALHKRLAPRRCVERRAAQKETRCHCYFHLRSRHHNRHLLQQVRQLSLRQDRHRRHRLQRVLLLAAAAAASAVASAVTFAIEAAILPPPPLLPAARLACASGRSLMAACSLQVQAPARTRLRSRAHAHNLPRLACSQVGNGPRQAGAHAIRVLREAQFALTYSIVLAVLAH